MSRCRPRSAPRNCVIAQGRALDLADSIRSALRQIEDALGGYGRFDASRSALPDAPSAIKRAALFEERYVSSVSAQHREIKKKLTLALFLKYPHLLITHVGDLTRAIDRLLDERGLKRQVAMSVPYHHAVPAIISGADRIATLSERVVRLSGWPGVRAFPVPIEFPSFRETMLWHRRNDSDPAHTWLRRLILDAGETLGNLTAAPSP